MAEMTEKELLNLKEEINKAKTKVSELTGKQNYLKKELLEWQCESVEDAVEKLRNMGEEIKELTNEIDERVEKIRTQYDV